MSNDTKNVEDMLMDEPICARCGADRDQCLCEDGFALSPDDIEVEEERDDSIEIPEEPDDE